MNSTKPRITLTVRRTIPSGWAKVNLAIEQSAWGTFRTEFYATYDYKPIWQEERRKTPGK